MIVRKKRKHQKRGGGQWFGETRGKNNKKKRRGKEKKFPHHKNLGEMGGHEGSTRVSITFVRCGRKWFKKEKEDGVYQGNGEGGKIPKGKWGKRYHGGGSEPKDLKWFIVGRDPSNLVRKSLSLKREELGKRGGRLLGLPQGGRRSVSLGENLVKVERMIHGEFCPRGGL